MTRRGMLRTAVLVSLPLTVTIVKTEKPTGSLGETLAHAAGLAGSAVSGQRAGAEVSEAKEAFLLAPRIVRYAIRMNIATEKEAHKARDLGLNDARVGTQLYKISPKLQTRLAQSGLEVKVVGGITEYSMEQTTSSLSRWSLVDSKNLRKFQSVDSKESNPISLRVPEAVSAQISGYFYLDSGEIDAFIPDGYLLTYSLRDSTATPEGAVTTGLEYQLRVSDEGDGNFACGEYQIYLDHGGSDRSWLLVYDRKGGVTDGGYDDDSEDDLDIELDWRTTSYFQDLDPKDWWMVRVLDSVATPYAGERDGQLDYIRFWVHWKIPPPSVSIFDRTVTEGDIGTTVAEFLVKLSVVVDDPVSVDWRTRDDTADSSDYAPSSGTVWFAPGETSKSVSVVVYGDTEEELDEVFYVDLSNSVNAEIDREHGRCTIRDDDRPVTLYDQTDFKGTMGVATQDFETAMDAYDAEAADDFFVPEGGWEITAVEVRGLYFDGDGPVEGMNFWFYRDSGGWPSSVAACSYSEIVPTLDGASEGVFGTIVTDLPSPCILSPGRHWLGVQARMDYADSGQFLWSLRTTQTGEESVWRNPGDGFGWGWTSWTRLTTAFPQNSDPDLIFLLKGWPNVPPIFVDDFECGDCSAWSKEVP